MHVAPAIIQRPIILQRRAILQRPIIVRACYEGSLSPKDIQKNSDLNSHLSSFQPHPAVVEVFFGKDQDSVRQRIAHDLFNHDPESLYGMIPIFPAMRDHVWNEMYNAEYQIPQLREPHAALKVNGRFAEISKYFGDRIEEEGDNIQSIIFSKNSHCPFWSFQEPLAIVDRCFRNVKNVEFHDVPFVMADYPCYMDGEDQVMWFFAEDKSTTYMKFVNCSFVEELQVSAYDPEYVYGNTCCLFYYMLAKRGYTIRFENTSEISPYRLNWCYIFFKEEYFQLYMPV